MRPSARLPSEAVLTFEGDLLGTVTVPLFQGESPDVLHNECLCTAVVTDARIRDGGRVRLRLAFDEHCMMRVEAFLERTGEPLEVVLDRKRALENILAELGVYAGASEPEAPWQLPETTIGKLFGTLFGMFKKKR